MKSILSFVSVMLLVLMGITGLLTIAALDNPDAGDALRLLNTTLALLVAANLLAGLSVIIAQLTDIRALLIDIRKQAKYANTIRARNQVKDAGNVP